MDVLHLMLREALGTYITGRVYVRAGKYRLPYTELTTGTTVTTMPHLAWARVTCL